MTCNTFDYRRLKRSKNTNENEKKNTPGATEKKKKFRNSSFKGNFLFLKNRLICYACEKKLKERK